WSCACRTGGSVAGPGHRIRAVAAWPRPSNRSRWSSRSSSSPAAMPAEPARPARSSPTRDNSGVSDIPRRAVPRPAKLAGLPLGLAGRATVGLGKRLGGRSSEEITLELQQRTAEQLFALLGQLKGGAMKFGQALSVFEAALPENLSAPYREALTKLQ